MTQPTITPEQIEDFDALIPQINRRTAWQVRASILMGFAALLSVVAIFASTGQAGHLIAYASALTLAVSIFAMGAIVGGTVLGLRVRRALPGDLRPAMATILQLLAIGCVAIKTWMFVIGR